MTANVEIYRGLVGRWTSVDPLMEDVEHRISTSKGEYKVAVTDTFDGEKAEVYDVKWDGDRLQYKVHWPSTGRFIEYSLTHLEKEKVGISFKYSAQDIWIKKKPVKSG